MKKIAIITSAVFFLATASFAQTWNWDKAHSQLNWSIPHLGISSIAGTFTTVDAKITSSKDDFSDASVTLTADVNSINTSNEQRNNHLKSPDFFDAAKYGTLTFTSTSFKKTGDKTFQVEGDLTFHGVTKRVTLNAVWNGTTTNPMSKKPVSGWTVTGSIHRADFGIGAKFPGSFLGDDVNLNAVAEFVKD